MGRRYYCDYCDKAFADNPTSRKNHLKGIKHQRLKKLHYSSFQDAATILANDRNRKPCRKFFEKGECEFQDACYFSHMTDERRREFEQQVEKQKAAASKRKAEEENPPSLDEWLAKRKKASPQEEEKVKKDSGVELPKYSIAPCLINVPNLPPSLLPPPPDVYKTLEFEDWG